MAEKECKRIAVSFLRSHVEYVIDLLETEKVLVLTRYGKDIGVLIEIKTYEEMVKKCRSSH